MQHVGIHTDSLILHHAMDEQKTDQYALHCHNYYEVFYFIAGEVSYLVEGKRYVPEPHSMLLIAPHVFHGVKIESNAPYERISLHFESKFLPPENRSVLLSPFHPEEDVSSGIYYADNGNPFMYPFFEQFMDVRHAEQTIRDLLLRVRLEALLSQILMISYSRRMMDEAPTSHPVSRIIDYLNEHISEPITLDHLSDTFFISKHHLNKMFRKATGTTVGHYLIHKRVVMAQNLMLQGQTASSAAASVGFHDYSAFFRSYKKLMGHAPSAKQNQMLLE